MAETLTNTNGALILKQSTIFNRAFFFGTTGTTVTVNISKVTLGGTPGAFGAAAGAVTEIANGWYNVALTTVDTNTPGILAYHCTGLAGGPVDFNDIIQTTIFTDLLMDGTGRSYITSNIKQNQPLPGFLFIMTVNGIPATGLSVTAQRTLGSSGFAPCTNPVTEVGGGWYAINLTAGDLNSATIGLRFTAGGADDRNILLIAQP